MKKIIKNSVLLMWVFVCLGVSFNVFATTYQVTWINATDHPIWFGGMGAKGKLASINCGGSGGPDGLIAFKAMAPIMSGESGTETVQATVTSPWANSSKAHGCIMYLTTKGKNYKSGTCLAGGTEGYSAESNPKMNSYSFSSTGAMGTGFKSSIKVNAEAITITILSMNLSSAPYPAWYCHPS